MALGSHFIWSPADHVGQYSRATSMLEDARAETIHRGHLESSPLLMWSIWREK